MLSVDNLYKNIGKNKILNGISFEVKKNEIFGLVGPKGAGKTTIAKILAGLIEPSLGKISFDGKEVDTNTVFYKKQIGYMPEDFLVYENLKVIEYMEFYASLYGISRKKLKKIWKEIFEVVKLEEKEEYYVDVLSRTMKQKLSLARCLIHEPKVLILDEPVKGMELSDQYELFDSLECIANRGTSIILISSVMSELEQLCSSLGMMHEGKMLLTGTAEEIKKQIRIEKPIIVKILSEEEIEMAVTVLKENTLIERISIDGREIQVVFRGKPEEENQLLVKLVERGVRVQSFARGEGSLEHLFLELMKEKKNEF